MPRKKKWDNAEDMQDAIDAYFDECDGEPLMVDGDPVLNKYGDPIMVNKHPPTVTGLALALGFRQRKSLIDYTNKDAEFRRVVETAKARVQDYAERRLYDRDGQRGAEFVLKYFFGVGKEEREAAQQTNVVILPAVVDDGGGADK